MIHKKGSLSEISVMQSGAGAANVSVKRTQ
jgi:hypothetical protein